MLVFFHPIILGSMPTSAASNLFFVPSIPIYWRWRRWTPYFLLKFQFVWLKSAKYPPLRTHEGWTPYFSSQNWFIGLKFVFLTPKRCRKVAQNWKTMGKIIELPSWWHTFWHFRSEEELQRLRANAGAAWSGAPVGTRWSWWLMVTGYHWNFTMISWRFNWNFTTK